MRIPIITDTHFGARGDSAVVYQIQEQFYQNVFWPALDAEGGVTEILHLGDVTDRRKYVNYVTLDKAKEMFFREAQRRGIRIHWILGNHDLPYKQSVKLSSHEAFREFTNVRIYDTATEVKIGSVSVLFMPWLCDENREASMKVLSEFTGSVVAGHFEFNDFEMYRGLVNTHGMDPAPFKSFPLVMSGHYHHKSSRDNIHYLGAPYELIWSDHGEPHGFHWWTPDTHQLDFVENPNHLFYKFLYNDARKPATYVKTLLDEMRAANVEQKIVKIVIRQRTQPLLFETFSDAVMRLGAHDVQFVDETAWTTDDEREDDALPTEASLDTLTMIHRYMTGLSWANTAFQTDATSLMTELYHEATDRAKTVSRS